MTTVTAPAPASAPAAERPRIGPLFRHEDLFQEPTYADGQPYDQDNEDDTTEPVIIL